MSVQLQRDSGTLRVILARPEKRNAFDGDMLVAIDDAIVTANSDDSVRVVVIQSQGTVFCAGADLRWMAAQAAGGPDANLEGAKVMGGVFHRVSACRKPVIARVQGATMGGGVGLASACDIVVASQNAYFALSEVRLGLVPAVISPFVTRRVGPARARALFMLGDRVPAQEAFRLGLADVVVDGPEELDDRVSAVIDTLYKGAPGAQYACKQLVDGIAWREPGEVLDFTASMIAKQRATPEANEGIAAFLGKRPANWIPTPQEPA